MKKLALTIGILVLLSASALRIEGQTASNQLDQFKLMQQFIGKWQTNFPKDTITTMEFQQFGKAFAENDYLTVKGKETLDSKWSYSFSPQDGKFKFFAIYSNGSYQTWTGSFVSEKKWVQEATQDFNPGKILYRAEMVFDTPTSMSTTAFDMKGEKIAEFKWSKLK